MSTMSRSLTSYSIRTSAASMSAALMTAPGRRAVKSPRTPSERGLDGGRADGVARPAVGEVEQHAVRDAVLERDRVRPGGVGHDVLARVEVGADVVVLHHQVAGGERVDPVGGGPDPLGELG